MKKTNQACFLLAVAMLLLLTGCAKSRLGHAVDQFNKSCPVKIGLVGNIKGATYEGDCVEVVYEMNELMDVGALKGNEEVLKGQLLANYSQQGMKEFVDAILAAEATLRFVYTNTDSDEKITITVSPDELRKAQNAQPPSADKLLDDMLFQANLQFPKQLLEGLSITAMQLEGDCVYYIYEVAPEIIEYEKEHLEEEKGQTISNLSRLSEMEKADLRKVPAAGKSLGYRYVCSTTGDAIEFVITNSQLIDILR